MRPTLVIAALLATGCRRPPEAPAELDALSRYLYAEWDNEDPDVLAVGLDNLLAFLEGVDLETGNVLDRSWELTPITEADVADVDRPDRDPADTLGVAVARASVWPVDDHARLQLERDQTVTEPTAASYVRTFPDDPDPKCFLDQSCNPLVTENTVERHNIVMSVTGELHKRFRWVTLDSGELGMISRSWISESWVGEKENSTVWQSFSIDVWLPHGKVAWRYQTLWSESDVAGASDAIEIGTVKASTDNIFEAGDEAIGTLYHGQ